MHYDDEDRDSDLDRVTRREIYKREYIDDSGNGTAVAIVLIIVAALVAILYWAFRDKPQEFPIPAPTVIVPVQPAPPAVTPVVPAPAPTPTITPESSLPDSASYEARRAAEEAKAAAREAEQRAREVQGVGKVETPPSAPVVTTPSDNSNHDGSGNIDSQDTHGSRSTDGDQGKSPSTNM